MTDRDLFEHVRRQAGDATPPQQRAERIAQLIRLHTGRHWIGIYTTGSELIVPVFADGQLLGTLVIEDARTETFSEDDQALFESVAAALTDLYHYAAP
jgi:GAF domain-containing protein